MNPRKLTDRIVVLNAPLTVGWGGQRVRDWPNARTTRDVPALLQVLGSGEDLDARDTTTTTWRLVVGPTVPLSGSSRVLSSDVVDEDGRPLPLEVQGEPGLFKKNGAVDHYEATLVVVDDTVAGGIRD